MLSRYLSTPSLKTTALEVGKQIESGTGLAGIGGSGHSEALGQC
jgi:hypothetical protein